MPLGRSADRAQHQVPSNKEIIQGMLWQALWGRLEGRRSAGLAADLICNLQCMLQCDVALNVSSADHMYTPIVNVVSPPLLLVRGAVFSCQLQGRPFVLGLCAHVVCMCGL